MVIAAPSKDVPSIWTLSRVTIEQPLSNLNMCQSELLWAELKQLGNQFQSPVLLYEIFAFLFFYCMSDLFFPLSQVF